jgi:hypothetical protein
MKTVAQFSFISLRILIGTVASSLAIASLVLSLFQPAIAQEASADLLEDDSLSGDNGSDPFAGNSGGSTGMFELFHRANLSGDRSIYEYSREQEQNINTAAEDFRTRQLDLLRQQQNPTDATDAVNEPVESNP